MGKFDRIPTSQLGSLPNDATQSISLNDAQTSNRISAGGRAGAQSGLTIENADLEKSAPQTRVITALIFAGLIMAIAVFAGAGFASWDARRRAYSEAERELQNLSFILANHADRAMQAVDLALTSTLERSRVEGGLAGTDAFALWAQRREAHQVLSDRVAALEQTDAILLIDANGGLLTSSRFFPPPPRDLADREYFREARDSSTGRAIGAPVMNRGTNTWAFHLAHRINSEKGEFLGVAVAVIELSYFNNLFGSLTLGPASSVSLFRSDGILLARHPNVSEAIGRDLSASAAFQTAVANGDGKTFRVVSLIDGQDRLFSGRSLNSFPLSVNVGIALDAALAASRAIAFKFAAGSLLLVAVLAGAVTLAARVARAEAMAAAMALQQERVLAAAKLLYQQDIADERLAHQRELADQHADFRVVVESMSPVVWRFSSDGNLILANERGVEVLGLPAGIIRGGETPIEIAQSASAAGAEGAAAAICRLAELAAKGEASSFVHDLGRGRAAAASLRPLPDGGWVATFEDVSEQRAAEERARHLAAHDPLTGLANRRQLEDRLESSLRSQADTRIALLSLDLDRFKQVNDALGHPAGDALLYAAAERIRANVRTTRPDGIGPTDLVARPGGDEFVVVLEGLAGDADTARATATNVAARLVSALSEPFILDNQQALVGASVGVALFPEDGATPDELACAADLALYRAKAEGRGRHRFFERGMDEAARERQSLEVDLRRALIEEGGSSFEVHFQPIVDVFTRAPRGAEALVRWRRAGTQQMISPAYFIPIAEETGLILPLGELVLRKACLTAAAWKDRSLRIAVNLSPAQVHSDGLVPMIEDALNDSGLEPHRLELEVTEGVLLQGTREALSAMNRLRSKGIRFAMDDFGTGYSSLSYLRTFPFDQLKIDGSFVREIGVRPQDASIVRTIITMCAELGITTVAEGVETEEQLAFLAGANCHEVQGYLFGRPVPAEKLWQGQA